MVQILPEQDLDWLYPSSDGKPMAENTKQYHWIVLIKENLEVLFANISDVFIAADLLWYPVQVENPPAPSQAPDIMIVFGRLKGERRSYRQWQENNIPPQVVFEILSESNKTSLGKKEMARKFTFYEQYGVEEYYIYDPDEFILEGWLRQGQQFIPIEQMSDWVSPRLQIRFAWHKGEELVLYRPDGERFLTFLDLEERWLTERQRAEQAEVALKEAQRQKQILREQLREMGINPDQF